MLVRLTSVQGTSRREFRIIKASRLLLEAYSLFRQLSIIEMNIVKAGFIVFGDLLHTIGKGTMDI